MVRPQIPATIVQEPSRQNGWQYVVDTDDGRRHFLAGIGCPQGGRVGDRGRVQYRMMGPVGAWYVWISAGQPG